jgi:hypothetical protein
MEAEELSILLAIIFVIAIGVLVVVWIVLGITYAFGTGYNWNQIESYFWLSDSSSSPQMKVEYLNKFIGELMHSGIAEYNSALWFPTPRGKAINVINQVISLRDRVAGLTNKSVSDLSYAAEWKQINEVEYCWIQLRQLECAYAIKNGWGIMCLWEPSYSEVC